MAFNGIPSSGLPNTTFGGGFNNTMPLNTGFGVASPNPAFGTAFGSTALTGFGNTVPSFGGGYNATQPFSGGNMYGNTS